MVLKVQHATLRVADPGEASERWARLYGLTAVDPAANGDSTLLRCAYEDFCLELRRSDEAPGVEHVAYELRSGVTLADAAARLRDAGSEPQGIEVPIRGPGLRVADPDGNRVVVVERVIPENRKPAVARFTDELPGFHPRRLQHFNYLTADTPRLADWYQRALGLEVSDWIGDGAVWLHADRDHHVVAFLDKGYSHIHHLAFELTDWGEIRVALDHLAQHRRPLAWGPGRHTMAQNLFAYCRMIEEEVFVEIFCDMEQLEPDHEPRFFADEPHDSNAWGILPPRSYFRFDPEAIEAERLQLEAQQGLR
jgi:catechol 2,3-dioxygenase-like lactoylglutathione lyase family enzyme